MAKSKKKPKAASAERWYARQLRKVARHVGDIISAFPPDDPAVEPVIRHTLERYSEVLDGWARETAGRMLAVVDKADLNAWKERTEEMGRELERVLRRTPIGTVMQARMAEQVTLIKSIPLEAGQRVHRLTLDRLEDSGRSKQIMGEILRSEDVAANRAKLIARTEVARTASLLTETRARAIGSKGYFWRTSGDSDVRHSHKEMDGEYVEWDAPPTLSDGTTTHAGQIYNCRCYPEPVVPALPS